MSLIDKLKKQLEKEVEKEVQSRIQAILNALNKVLEEQKITNKYLREILEVLKNASTKEEKGRD